MNPHIMNELAELGQAIWLDYIHRLLLTGGGLKELVSAGLRGVTSNPTIFANAITSGHDYDASMRAILASQPGASARELYEALTVEDVQLAADQLAPAHERTGGTDGFVSLEVSPLLAHDTAGTIEEAKRLWGKVARPNLMIKVPATPEGVPAIEALIGLGINVNVTLIFSLAHHEAVAKAHLRGLAKAPDPSKVHGVASFFVSRVDTACDKQLLAIGTPAAKALMGKLAIANAKRAYRLFEDLFGGAEFAPLKARGAKVQRPLWASTGTKNPAYSDLMYVETLIGDGTVNTLPPATLEALRDHGTAKTSIRDGLAEADAQVAALEKLGIDLERITATLQKEGVASFAASYEQLITALETKRRQLIGEEHAPMSVSVRDAYSAETDAQLAAWEEVKFGKRLWAGDATLWSKTNEPELSDRLGWLRLAEITDEARDDLHDFARGVAREGIKDVVLLGMGGSSLAPEVFQTTFGNAPGYPALTVLDTTHPAAVREVTARIDVKHALFVVSSKSGTTPESTSFFNHFWKAAEGLGSERGKHFVAITDPGTALDKLGKERRFRRVFSAPADVGGRYSALSVFGLVPAALIGIDVGRLVRRAGIMADACGPERPAIENPGLVLGATLAVLSKQGRGAVTFVTGPGLHALPAWIEQLVAESTGKDDRGVLPVDGEPLGAPEVYGDDRIFVSIELAYVPRDPGAPERAQKLQALEAAGHPVIRITLPSAYDLGQELFRWELATAAAGAALGIHPFNQPDVQLAKDLARKAMTSSAAPGAGVPVVPLDDVRAAATTFFAGARAGDYVSIHAYLAPSADTTTALQGLRIGLRNRLRLATTLGYGPRFLHSTGQLHKGGADNGLFVQLVDEPTQDTAVPDTDFTFARLIKAQAEGDSEALRQRGRRLLRVSLGKDAGPAAVRRLAEALSEIHR